jgi:hypothetical protein
MELFLLLGGLVVALIVGYPFYQRRQEQALEKRLEQIREHESDPAHAAAEANAMVDAAITRSRREADAFSRLRDHRY